MKARDLYLLGGLEKFLVWDVIMVKFFKEFWQDLKEPIVLIGNRAFQDGLMKGSVLKGLIKPIPKHVICSLQKH